MPAYEYKCLDCNRVFTAFLSFKEKEQGDVQCPNCGSKNLQQIYSTFHAVTSKKS
ncbi:MAG: zinc ribbon domain-containing protein [Nitrospirota bacterium]